MPCYGRWHTGPSHEIAASDLEGAKLPLASWVGKKDLFLHKFQIGSAKNKNLRSWNLWSRARKYLLPMELRLKQFNKRLNRDFKSNVLKFFGKKNTVQIARAMAWWERKHCITSAGLSKRTCIKTLITISNWRRNYYGAVTWYRISCCESDTYYTNLSKTFTVWRHFFETYQFHPISVRLQSIKLTYSARKPYPLGELVVKAWWLNPPHERFLG